MVGWFCCRPRFLLEGGVYYEADFLVMYANGRVEIQDVKGGKATQTKVYRPKKRQVEARYGVTIVEV